MRRKRLAGIGLGLIMAAAPVAAEAASYHYMSVNSAASAFNSGAPTYTWFNVSDLKCDNYATYGFWSTGVSTGRVDNKSGCNKRVSSNLGREIKAVRACVNIPLATDPCSNWG
ncbi:MAG: hypothetical protein LWW86_03560 [Micrococcales bacterium]|nr:hypothetical protein [Micrococcales bacterium]